MPSANWYEQVGLVPWTATVSAVEAIQSASGLSDEDLATALLGFPDRVVRDALATQETAPSAPALWASTSEKAQILADVGFEPVGAGEVNPLVAVIEAAIQ